MDYTIGSLADIISGKNTPNKPAVIKKQIVNPNNSAQVFITQDKSEQPDSTKAKRDGKKFKKSMLAFKRNRLNSDRKVEQNSSFKKENRRNERIENQSNFTVIDHIQITKIEKRLDEKAFDETSSGNGDTDMKSTHVKQNNDKEVDSRTIFVGNIATTIKKTQLLKFFGKYGKVVSVRLRCATPAEPGVSKRVAVIKKMFHPKRTTLHSYVT